MYVNRLKCGRCCLCTFGLLFVVLIGLGAGLMAFYLPDLLAGLGTREFIYNNMKSLSYDDRVVKLSNSSCPNYMWLQTSPEDDRLVYQCEDKTQCVPMDARCSGYYDCDDQSDETNCEQFCNEAVEKDIRFKCGKQTIQRDAGEGPTSPDCFLDSYRCDGMIDCPEDNPNEEQMCSSDYSVRFRRDNSTIYCSRENNFLCSDKGYCVKETNVCDSLEDCGDASDELNCTP